MLVKLLCIFLIITRQDAPLPQWLWSNGWIGAVERLKSDWSERREVLLQQLALDEVSFDLEHALANNYNSFSA